MSEEPEHGSRRSADLIIARLEGRVETLVTTVLEIRTWLMGSGTPENPGVMIRLDRLEQTEIKREDAEGATKRWRIGLITSIGLLFIERFGHYLIAWLSKH